MGESENNRIFRRPSCRRRILSPHMDFEQRVIIRFLFKEGVDANDIHMRLLAQFRDEASSLRSVQRCCQYVREGRELMHDEPRSRWSPVDFLDI
jgi:cell division FtsZ-interacting protein ZapD